jgi:hypothetical protein
VQNIFASRARAITAKKTKGKGRARAQKISSDRHTAEYHSDEKPLFHRAFFNVGIFAREHRTTHAQNVFVSRFAFAETCLDDRIASAYTQERAESLFFSLRWCKRIAVQVDSRPH